VGGLQVEPANSSANRRLFCVPHPETLQVHIETHISK
jgi:hypothetical protein